MVKIRLARRGAKKQATYRVVVANSEAPRDGSFIEIIGHYNPRTDPPTVVIDEERALYWLGVGAQPTEAVARMLRNLGIMAKFQGEAEQISTEEEHVNAG
ncbi:MAG: 30S ribosomal protein S16 [Anaerolineae bacterium]|jgi:small subunit ribosomal protein S16